MLASNLKLGYVIDFALVDVGVLVHDRNRIQDRVVVNLSFIVVEVQLHLGCFLNRTAQLVAKAI